MDVIGIADYLVGFVIMAGIYGVFALGLNVHWGFTGLFNIGIAGFFALGAYTSALLTTPPPDLALVEDFKFGGNWAQLGFLDLGFDLWFFLGIAAAAAVCGVIALGIGYVTLRLRDDYLAIATLGIAETVRLVFLNEKWLANGSKGLYRIPEFLDGLVAPENYDYLYLPVVIIFLAILFLAVERAVKSPWGRVLRAIREDDTAAAASGKDVFRFKLQAFILGAVIMGIGGALFAHHVRFLAPITFDPAAGHLRHLGHADGGRLRQQQRSRPRRVHRLGNLDRYPVLAGAAGRPQLPVLYDWRPDNRGNSAAARRHTGRGAQASGPKAGHPANGGRLNRKGIPMGQPFPGCPQRLCRM